MVKNGRNCCQISAFNFPIKVSARYLLERAITPGSSTGTNKNDQCDLDCMHGVPESQSTLLVKVLPEHSPFYFAIEILLQRRQNGKFKIFLDQNCRTSDRRRPHAQPFI
jgi:hypothetical protein